MKIFNPELDLPGTENAFNLFSETSVDGERVQREEAFRKQAEREAKEIEEKRQQPLFGQREMI